MTGYIHSIFSGGMADGPGIRCVIFLSGCPLRCLYCHNPDSWGKPRGKKWTVEEIVDEVLKYRSFYKFSGGGVTFSGGEPLMQPEFLAEALKACRARGIHTAVDTSGFANAEAVREVLKHTDLLLLDIKSYNPRVYKKVTGVSIDKTLEFLQISQEMRVPTWIRYVLVPGLTDGFADMRNLAEFLRGFDNIEKIEVLPFHKQGEYKWKTHNVPYELADTGPPSKELLDAAKEILEKM